MLAVDCREVTALRNVAGEGSDLAVGLRNASAFGGSAVCTVVRKDAKQ